MLKVCNSCSTEKSIDFFGVRSASKDGLAAKCKQCQKDYDKKRANDPHRVSAREKYQSTPDGAESVRKAKINWANRNRGKIKENTKEYRKRNPKKYKAHGKVAYEVRIGNLTRKPCEVCGEQKAVAHHDDYDKALDVRWLCQSHHKQWHAEHGEGLNGI